MVFGDISQRLGNVRPWDMDLSCFIEYPEFQSIIIDGCPIKTASVFLHMGMDQYLLIPFLGG